MLRTFGFSFYAKFYYFYSTPLRIVQKTGSPILSMTKFDKEVIVAAGKVYNEFVIYLFKLSGFIAYCDSIRNLRAHSFGNNTGPFFVFQKLINNSSVKQLSNLEWQISHVHASLYQLKNT